MVEREEKVSGVSLWLVPLCFHICEETLEIYLLLPLLWYDCIFVLLCAVQKVYKSLTNGAIRSTRANWERVFWFCPFSEAQTWKEEVRIEWLVFLILVSLPYRAWEYQVCDLIIFCCLSHLSNELTMIHIGMCWKRSGLLVRLIGLADLLILRLGRILRWMCYSLNHIPFCLTYKLNCILFLLYYVSFLLVVFYGLCKDPCSKLIAR